MIKINLMSKSLVLNASSSAGQESGPAVVTDEIRNDAAKKFLLILLFPVILYGYEYYNIDNLQSSLRSEKRKLNELINQNANIAGLVDERRKIEADEATLLEQLKVIEELKKNRIKEVKILDGVQASIPERVWLSRIDYTKEKIVISGYTVSDGELSRFMDDLGKSIFLKEIALLKSSEVSSDRGAIKKFEISASVIKEMENSGGVL